jgi:hypothetical protein
MSLTSLCFCPRWEENYEPHMEIFNAVQSHRQSILSCEILDSNCMNYFKPEERLGNNQDVIFLEVKSSAFEDIYSHVFCGLCLRSHDNIFKIAENKFHHVRAGAPQAIFEENSKMGVVKVGTDVQVTADKFIDLLNFYREFSKIGVRYGLFGHFGDAHLHFNYMPSKDQSAQCEDEFRSFMIRFTRGGAHPLPSMALVLSSRNISGAFMARTNWGFFMISKRNMIRITNSFLRDLCRRDKEDSWIPAKR